MYIHNNCDNFLEQKHPCNYTVNQLLRNQLIEQPRLYRVYLIFLHGFSNLTNMIASHRLVGAIPRGIIQSATTSGLILQESLARKLKGEILQNIYLA